MNFKIKPQPYRPGASFLTLLEKEILRFKKIALQTIFAPVLMGLLYLLVFGQVLAGKMPTFDGVNYLHFLVPGLVMMTMLQNAFGNSSSSMLSSKIMGSLIFIQLPPFAGWELSLAMIGASIVRALIVGAGVLLASFLWSPPPMDHLQVSSIRLTSCPRFSRLYRDLIRSSTSLTDFGTVSSPKATSIHGSACSLSRSQAWLQQPLRRIYCRLDTRSGDNY